MKTKKSNKTNFFGITIACLIFVFIVFGIFANRYAYFSYDLAISRAVQSIHRPGFSVFMNLVSEVGDNFNLEIIVVLSMSLLFFAGLKSEAIKTALLTVAGASTGSLIKSLINRPRPSGELVNVQKVLTDNSFPSMHVLIFTVFFGYVLYLAISKVKTLWLRLFIAGSSTVLILFIGISRIYLGAHWTSDTLGGYLLGVILLVFAIQFSRKSSND